MRRRRIRRDRIGRDAASDARLAPRRDRRRAALCAALPRAAASPRARRSCTDAAGARRGARTGAAPRRARSGSSLDRSAAARRSRSLGGRIVVRGSRDALRRRADVTVSFYATGQQGRRGERVRVLPGATAPASSTSLFEPHGGAGGKRASRTPRRRSRARSARAPGRALRLRQPRPGRAGASRSACCSRS